MKQSKTVPATGRKTGKQDRGGGFRLEDWNWSWSPRSQKEAGDAIVTNFMLHWFPNRVSLESISIRYSYWLGTITAFLFFYLVFTGVILMFHYIPSVERAYASIKDIEYAVSFGSFLRASHRIAAHLMVAMVFLHMVRVFLTGAYRNGGLARQFRPLNWWIGLVLLVLTLFLSFTGYLLPWDQLAYWAITVGTNIAQAVPVVGNDIRFFLLGGNEINQNTLIRFYVLHCVFLPLIVTGLFLWHMWRIRKDGMACDDRLALAERAAPARPEPSKTYSLLGVTAGRSATVEASLVDEDRYKIRAVPGLIRRISIACLLTFALTSALAVWLGSPLEEPANPMVTPNPAKAPWYFLWLQELVAITTVRIGGFTVNGGFLGGVLIPGAMLLWGFLTPFLDRSSRSSVGVWFSRERRLQNTVFIVVCIAVIALTYLGTYLRGPYWTVIWPWESWPDFPPQL